jgi:hypothetical protein
MNTPYVILGSNKRRINHQKGKGKGKGKKGSVTWSYAYDGPKPKMSRQRSHENALRPISNPSRLTPQVRVRVVARQQGGSQQGEPGLAEDAAASTFQATDY